MALDVSILRDSFATVVERSPQVIARFYEIFFERFPEVRPMFGRAPAGIARQEKMLTDALVAVLDHLEDAPWLQETLFALGAKHVGYGVRDEMYGWVGQCLLAALAEAGGDAWTPAVEAQWAEAFGAIQSMMLAGAHAARSPVDAARERVTVV
jgi:hemoglobin-like flavoprotein